ncbi:uncharacterized protein Z518_03770 [Rhinocladiella mackenziei CBS 650.93]|uniref:Uncharacterized protein n=1 Tax=Rhinocladiella mackenziei CBS 650.93 TaxID=1442369 RepID=A0A0D2H5W2_9EURO|nr:uncharacterized protein Z518_03770 [Rhinocladiella mackenziei CBS 650.93]KIX05798.1 hypothetical protein Z518_03770 [Rhinocladiella mackenziei CBS 650.93]
MSEHPGRWLLASGTMDSHLLAVSGVTTYFDGETKTNPTADGDVLAAQGLRVLQHQHDDDKHDTTMKSREFKRGGMDNGTGIQCQGLHSAIPPPISQRPRPSSSA